MISRSLSAQDTAELSFTDVPVPAANLLGEAARGMAYLKRNLTQECLSVTVTAAATVRRVLEETIAYTRDRIAGSTSSRAACNCTADMAI
ncbi:hypothetical protein [Streptomyces sp. NPDC000618]|uniref:hypothetical protein n=1 Tax=Streptomyces sp. NPDC000618 TaxID=3154265 RepID=UPI00332260BB